MISGKATDVLVALNLIGKAVEVAEKYQEEGMTFEDALDKAAQEVFTDNIGLIKKTKIDHE